MNWPLFIGQALQCMLLLSALWVAARWMRRRFRLKWEAFLLGAVALVGARLAEIAILETFAALFQHGILGPIERGNLWLNPLILALSAAIGYEAVRAIAIARFWPADTGTKEEGAASELQRCWAWAVGFAGTQALLSGLMATTFLLLAFAYHGEGPAAFEAFGADPQMANRLAMRVDLFWQGSWYADLLTLSEHLSLASMHLLLTLLMWRALRAGGSRWDLLLAVAWHTLLAFVVHYGASVASLMQTQLSLLGLFALNSLWILRITGRLKLGGATLD